MEFITVALLAALCAARKNARRMESCCKEIQLGIPVQIQPDPQEELRKVGQIVSEATAVISKTRDIEVGIRNFAVIRSSLTKLSATIPQTVRFTMSLGDRELGREIEVGTVTSEEALNNLESEWMRGLLMEKIDTLIRQSEAISDPVLRTDLLREAVREALKGLEYMPGNEEFRIRVERAERRLSFLAGGE